MKHLRILIATFLTILAHAAIADETKLALEYKVKGVVLINFTKYIKWPTAAFTSDQAPINVCVVGENRFGDVFTSPDSPKEAQGRPLKLVELTGPTVGSKGPECQVLFWTKNDEKAVAAALPALEKSPILLVSDEEYEKGLISFTVVEGKLRFKIRRKAAEALGFELSSQLLKLAIIADD
jgi:YfiR/HmsC-like